MWKTEWQKCSHGEGFEAFDTYQTIAARQRSGTLPDRVPADKIRDIAIEATRQLGRFTNFSQSLGSFGVPAGIDTPQCQDIGAEEDCIARGDCMWTWPRDRPRSSGSCTDNVELDKIDGETLEKSPGRISSGASDETATDDGGASTPRLDAGSASPRMEGGADSSAPSGAAWPVESGSSDGKNYNKKRVFHFGGFCFDAGATVAEVGGSSGATDVSAISGRVCGLAADGKDWENQNENKKVCVWVSSVAAQATSLRVPT